MVFYFLFIWRGLYAFMWTMNFMWTISSLWSMDFMLYVFIMLWPDSMTVSSNRFIFSIYMFRGCGVLVHRKHELLLFTINTNFDTNFRKYIDENCRKFILEDANFNIKYNIFDKKLWKNIDKKLNQIFEKTLSKLNKSALKNLFSISRICLLKINIVKICPLKVYFAKCPKIFDINYYSKTENASVNILSKFYLIKLYIAQIYLLSIIFYAISYSLIFDKYNMYIKKETKSYTSTIRISYFFSISITYFSRLSIFENCLLKIMPKSETEVVPIFLVSQNICLSQYYKVIYIELLSWVKSI